MKKLFLSIIISLLFIFSLLSLMESKHETPVRAHFDNPNRATELDFEKMKDPLMKQIPFERFPVAMQQTKQEALLAKGMANLNWTQIPSDMGGRTKTICFDPNDSAHHKLWAGAATGGLWVNQDISNPNSAWTPVGDVWETLSVSSIVFDPNNPQIMYVGTGEYETAIVDMYRESSGRGYGIWKSTDGGQTFQRLLTTLTFSYISDLAIYNDNGQSILYAGVVSGIYRGTNFSAQPSEGLYRSVDGGENWTQVLPGIPGEMLFTAYAPSDIEITANGKILVGTKANSQGKGGACILSSDTGVSGSWTINTTYQTQILNDNDYNIPGRVKLASAPSNPNRIYAVIAAKSTQQTIEGFPQTIGKLILKSNDAGVTWNNLPLPQGSQNNWAYLAWHALSVSVDPNNKNAVFVGGLDTFVSRDSGASWDQVSNWIAMYYGGGDEYVHGDIHKLLYAPGSSNTLCIATDGGVFYTQNATSNNIAFEQHNKSYNTLQYYSAAISKTGPDGLLGGLQDNGSLLYSGTPLNNNDMIQGGDGAFCTFDDNEIGLMITSTYDNKIMVYDANTNTSNRIYSYASGLFTTTFDYDSQNNVIWAIASDLHDNRLNQVLKLTDIRNGENGQFINLHTNTDKYFSAIRLIDADNILIGTANGKLYKVSQINASPVATQIDQGVLPNGFISCIQTGNNGQRILLTISNYGVASVWQSLDGGTTWHDVEGNLPDMPVRWAIYHPQNPNQVMLATETGIWTTSDVNATPIVWTPQNNGFPNVRVDMLDIRPDNNKVVAGTHGRSMFITTWDAILSTPESTKIDFSFYPNPATEYIQLSIPKLHAGIKILDLNGRIIKSFVNKRKQHRIDVSDLKKGYYLLLVDNSVKKILIQ